jgi:hypothetical protein
MMWGLGGFVALEADVLAGYPTARIKRFKMGVLLPGGGLLSTSRESRGDGTSGLPILRASIVESPLADSVVRIPMTRE